MLEQFKNELRNYNYYVAMKKNYDEKLDDLWYQLSMVKGIRYDKEGGSYDINLMNSYKFELMRKIDNLETEVERVNLQLAYLNNVLIKITDIELRQALVDVYCNKMSLRKASKKYYISHTALLKRFNKVLSEALNAEQ